MRKEIRQPLLTFNWFYQFVTVHAGEKQSMKKQKKKLGRKTKEGANLSSISWRKIQNSWIDEIAHSHAMLFFYKRQSTRICSSSFADISSGLYFVAATNLVASLAIHTSYGVVVLITSLRVQ